MANFTAGTSFSDGVTNDVTAAKLNALVADAVPTSNLSLNSTTGTIATLVATTLITTGTGTAASPAIVPTGDTNTGIFFPAADTIAFAEGGAEAMRIDSSGNVGIGITSPINNLGYGGITLNGTSGALLSMTTNGTESSRIASIGNDTSIQSKATTGIITFVQGVIGGTERLRIDASGNVGVGTASPVSVLDISNASDTSERAIKVQNSSCNLFVGVEGTSANRFSGSSANNAFLGTTTADGIEFATNNTVRTIIDSSGNVGIGNSSPSYLQHNHSLTENATALALSTISNSSSAGSLGLATKLRVGAMGASNNNGVSEIHCLHNLYNDSKSALKFLTNDGSSLVERLRIDSSGNLLVGKTVLDIDVAGSYSEQSGRGRFTTNSAIEVLTLNRQDSDGIIVDIRQANTSEGSISVSGTTVSYNGGHLSRWSQLLSGQRDASIKKGTVMSNLNEMCEWFDKDGNLLPNEQLNKVKVSDIEGESNVAGVFVNWDDDDKDNPFDLNMAMTGDMIIRIAQGTSVNRGDLLMSAGDGTTKPQGDDIIRSKTIAKVTSTNVTCTYEDGSYCVPCVLMAC